MKYSIKVFSCLILLMFSTNTFSQSIFPEYIRSIDSLNNSVRIFYYKSSITDMHTPSQRGGSLWLYSDSNSVGFYKHSASGGFYLKKVYLISNIKMNRIDSIFQKYDFLNFPKHIPNKPHMWPSGTIEVGYRSSKKDKIYIVVADAPPMKRDDGVEFREFAMELENEIKNREN